MGKDAEVPSDAVRDSSGGKGADGGEAGWPDKKRLSRPRVLYDIAHTAEPPELLSSQLALVLPQNLEDLVRDLDISGHKMARADAACNGLAVHDVWVQILAGSSTLLPTALGIVDAVVSTLMAVAEGGEVVLAAAAQRTRSESACMG